MPLVVMENNNTKECALLGLKLQLNSEMSETELRFFQPGDVSGNKKLKHALLELGIPAPERKFLPLLAKRSSNEVAWHFPQKHVGVHIASLQFPFVVGQDLL